MNDTTTPKVRQRSLFSASLIGLLLVTAALAGAQDATATSTNEMTASVIKAPTNTFTFKGGTISEYTMAATHLFPNANIVVDDRVANFQMPAMRLHNVSIDALVWLINNIEGTWNNSNYSCEVDRYGSPGSADVYRVFAIKEVAQRGRSTSTQGGRMTQSPSSRFTEVESVADMMRRGQITSDEIISTLHSAMQLDGQEGKPAIISYDSKTQLIMINGTRDDLQTFEEVLDEVRETSMVLSEMAEHTQASQASEE